MLVSLWTRQLWHRLVALCLLGGMALASADDFLPPEEAFRVTATAADARSVDVRFDITDGYYLYRDQFKFEALAADATLGQAQLPAGKVKFDDTFQKNVETYRGAVVARVPVSAAPAAFDLTVTSQGCADKGLCYPPMQTRLSVRLAGFGGDGSVVAVNAVKGPPLSGLAGGSAASTPPLAAAGAHDGAVDGALRSGKFWLVISVFFAAGLLLAFTPCVLPMLPILSSIIVGQHGSAPSRSRGLWLAVMYSLGMALVYTALGIAAGLAGEGLAATLQNPWVLGAFAGLLSILALSMFGAYELQLPSALRDRLTESSGRLQGGQALAVFAMGGLSALIVSPCVAAPLAGALLYISQTRDVALGGTALFSLAAGMSVPLLLVGASAGALLPKAGAWMEGVKRFFGVLLLGAAWWTVSPVVPASVAVAGWGVLLLVAAAFVGAFDRLPDAAGAARRIGKASGLALAVAGAVQIVGASAGAGDALTPLAPLALRGEAQRTTSDERRAVGEQATTDASAAKGQPANTGFQRIASSAELDAALRSAGRPVMLDFYADWCVSCKEMERFTFNDPAVRARLDRALLLQADVTRNSEADRALLKRFKLFGPPGIVFFDAAGNELPGLRVVGFQNAVRFGDSLRSAGL